MSDTTNFALGPAADDPLYLEAKQTVVATQHASISGAQRHLKIGYNRAARFIEQMEVDGIVSAPAYDGRRTVLTKDQP